MKNTVWKQCAKIIGLSILLNIAIIGLIGAVVYFNRVTIFNSFASEYLSESRKMDVEKRDSTLRLLSQESLVVDIVEKSNPAVISIIVTKDVPVLEQYYENYSPFGDLFGNDFFNFQIPRVREKGTEEQVVGGGSGFIVSEDGFIVTNKHVVSDPKASYTVLTNDGEKIDAEVVAKDSLLDIAVLRVKSEKKFPFLSFGDSDNLKPGQTVIAIGNALGEFRNSVSVGVVSGLSRSVVAGDLTGSTELLEEVIQTDAAINPGNSGGPLFDLQGKVIGINVAVAVGSENIGFALPASIVKNAVESVKKFGEIIRPFIGVHYQRVTEAVQKEKNLSVNYGALIVGDNSEPAVVPDSPAQKAGIKEGDIILEFDGTKINEDHSLGVLVRKKSVGDSVTLKILRDGKEKTVTIVLKKAPESL